MLKEPESVIGRPLGNPAAIQLLTNYVLSVNGDLDLSTPRLRHVFRTHVHDLVALAIGATRDGAELAQNRGLRAARLAAIKADIVANLSRRDLTADKIGRVHGVSAGYVRRLLAGEGTSFMDFLREQRLLHADRALSDRDPSGRTISAIAYESGFNDLSHFNRTFRRRFGLTPSEVRATAERS